MKRFAKKGLAGALSLAMVLGMTAVVNPETAEAKKVTVKKVTVTAPSGKTAYVAKGKKIKLTATVKVTPNKKANKKYLLNVLYINNTPNLYVFKLKHFKH